MAFQRAVMVRWSTGALIASIAMGCPGCYLSHERIDAGPDATVDTLDEPADAARVDMATDGGPMIDAASCQRIDGFRRCDFACPAMCSGADGRCDYSAQVCRRDFPEQGVGCFTESFSDRYCIGGDWYCVTNTAVSVPDAGPFTYTFSGTCMPIDFCRDAPAAGMNVACVYSDGLPFVDGPPAGSCPPTVDPMARPCGGACGSELCPDQEFCMGVSEERAFGVCASGALCAQELVGMPGGNDLSLQSCSLVTGESCACLVPTPQHLDVTGRFERGWAVPSAACRAYASSFPGQARCVDPATWLEL